MRSIRILTLLCACTSLYACELVADFDRGKLDAGKPVDAGLTPIIPDDPDAMDAGDVDADAAK